MRDLGRVLQLMGLVIVPSALLVPERLAEFSVLLLGAGIFLVGRQLAARAE